MAEPGERRQLVTTWGIPVQPAGQTTATLRRVNEQVRRSGRGVELLTFDGARDVADMTAQLQARSAWTPGLVLRNAFDDLRAWDADDTLLDRLADRPDAPEAEVLEAVVVSEERTRWCVRTYDAEGRLHTSTMLRADGSVLCRDFPVEVEGRRRRHQQLYARDGTPTRLLGSSDAFFVWLDALLGDDEAVVVNESKASARFLYRYPNPRVTLVHLFHESHLLEPDPYGGALVEQHRRLLPRLDRWDAAVFLTRLQRDDVALRFGESGNLHAVPNAGPAAAPAVRTWRGEPTRPDLGVVVSRLDPPKRIEQAVAAVSAVRRAGGPGRHVRLDVYGQDVGAQADIEEAIADTGSAAYVALRGYTDQAPQRFAEASFSLMTSRSEGQSLVLLESMAQGCVPISYDVRYGPADLVVDGENGFLVPDGDVDALADTIARFLALPGRKVRAMRDAARERLAGYTDDEAYRRWVEVQEAALALRPYRGSLTQVEVLAVAFGVSEPLLTVTARVAYAYEDGPGAVPAPVLPAPVLPAPVLPAPVLPAPVLPEARLLLAGRNGGRPRRVDLAVAAVEPGVVEVTGRFDPIGLALDRTVSDVSLELQVHSSVRRSRLRSSQLGAPEVGLPGTASAHLFWTTNGNLSLRRS